MAGEDEESPTEEHTQNAKRLNIRLIMPNEEENFLYTHNPLWCGTTSFQISIDAEQAGLSLSNYHTIISNLAHIYKAAQRSGFINGEWTQMEKMITMHRESIFNNKFPRSSFEAFDRFVRSMSIQRLATGKGSVGPQCKPAHFSNTFRKHFGHQASLEQSLITTKTLVQENMLQILESKHKRRDVRRNFTSQQFLAALSDFLPAVIPNITFDYIRKLTLPEQIFLISFDSGVYFL